MVLVSTSTTTTTATAMAGDDSHQSIGAGAGKNTGLKAVGNSATPPPSSTPTETNSTTSTSNDHDGLDMLSSTTRTSKTALPISPAPTTVGGGKSAGGSPATVREIGKNGTATTTTTRTTVMPNTLSASVPAARPTLSHGYVTTSVIPTTAALTRRSSKSAATTGVETGKAPVLFDFRTTDRSPSTATTSLLNAKKGEVSASGSGSGSTSMSLLSQGLKDGTGSVATPIAGQANSKAFPPSTSANNSLASGILRRTSTSGGKSGIYSPMPAPRMRPRAMSMQMKIKGEILPDGAASDDEEDDEDEGMVVDGDEIVGADGERRAVPLGTGSGGIKGKRKGMVFRCESCAKVYRHPSCLSKHRWEHSPHWANSSKLLLSKHQQVQLLEAATILVHLDPTNPAGQGKSLPDDKSLWPAAVSPAIRGNIKLPTRGISPGVKSPYAAPSALPGTNNTRKASPDDSSSSTESSDRAHSVEADSGYSSGPQHGRLLDIGETPRRGSVQFGRATISSPLGQSVGSNGQGSLPDFGAFHISSPSRYSTTPTHGGSSLSGSNGNKPGSHSFGRAYSYGSSHGTARGPPNALFSPSYSPALGLPQSSLRSGTFLERHDEDSAEEDEDDSYRDRERGYGSGRGSSQEKQQNGGFASRGAREMSMDRESPDGDDMDMAVDMEI